MEMCLPSVYGTRLFIVQSLVIFFLIKQKILLAIGQERNTLHHENKTKQATKQIKLSKLSKH